MRSSPQLLPALAVLLSLGAAVPRSPPEPTSTFVVGAPITFNYTATPILPQPSAPAEQQAYKPDVSEGHPNEPKPEESKPEESKPEEFKPVSNTNTTESTNTTPPQKPTLLQNGYGINESMLYQPNNSITFDYGEVPCYEPGKGYNPGFCDNQHCKKMCGWPDNSGHWSSDCYTKCRARCHCKCLCNMIACRRFGIDPPMMVEECEGHVILKPGDRPTYTPGEKRE